MVAREEGVGMGKNGEREGKVQIFRYRMNKSW